MSIEHTRAPRVGEWLGVHSLDHFCLTVPDLAQAADFYNAFGLNVEGDGKALGLRTQGRSHQWGLLLEGSRKQIQHLSFGAYADDLPRFREHLRSRGVEILPPPTGFETEGLWFRGHDGILIEIRAAEKSSPDVKSSFALEPPASAVRATISRSQAPRVYPRRLAHVAVFTADVESAIAFYQNVLGLRLSDRSGDVVAFLHGAHGSDHHLIALVKSAGSGFHHCSWDVGSVQDIGLGAAYMAVRGHDRGWGLGRHVLGSNYFHYVRDPWGSYSEYSAGMDFIPQGLKWSGTDQAVEDAMFLWGPMPPEDFAHNYEITA